MITKEMASEGFILSGYLRLVLADPGVYPHPGLYSVHVNTDSGLASVVGAPV